MACCSTCRTNPLFTLGGALLIAGALIVAGCIQSASDTAVQEEPMPSVLDYTVNRIDGEPQDLTEYKGEVVLVVNVASKCGMTPQYAGLEALYEQKRGDGLVVLGFPANNFGGQEPGANDEIAEFCSATYGVTFPMFEKISVKGGDAHPLYVRLAADTGEGPDWNFTKYLIDRDGTVVARFSPRTGPDDTAFVAKIDELLAE